MAHRHPWVPATLALPPERVEVHIRDEQKREAYSTRQVIDGRWCYIAKHPHSVIEAPMPVRVEWRFPDDYEPGQALDSGDTGTATATHDGRDDRSASGDSLTL